MLTRQGAYAATLPQVLKPEQHAEGVLFAEKDFNLAEHPEIPGIPNLQVIKLMQSFKSKELVTERFAWRHYYWWVLPACAQCW